MSRRKKVLLGALAVPSAAWLLAAMPYASAAAAGWSAIATRSQLVASAVLAQEDSGGEDTDVPPQDVEKYIKVYRAMQQNRNLTVEQAAAQQGLSVAAFRSLENRIERNDALREHVRNSLRPQSTASPAQ